LKKILLILKNNNRFDLKGTIKNNYNNNNNNCYCYCCCCCCYYYYYYLFSSLVNWKKYIITIKEIPYIKKTLKNIRTWTEKLNIIINVINIIKFTINIIIIKNKKWLWEENKEAWELLCKRECYK
jgi:hypothetical protein